VTYNNRNTIMKKNLVHLVLEMDF